MTIGQYNDMRYTEMRDFHPSEGNTFSDECVRLAGDKPVLLRRDQRDALRDHLDAVATSLDPDLWGYCGSYYELYEGALGPHNVHVLKCSEFDPYLPAPDAVEPLPHDNGDIPF
jgi:hypothetical protein